MNGARTIGLWLAWAWVTCWPSALGAQTLGRRPRAQDVIDPRDEAISAIYAFEGRTIADVDLVCDVDLCDASRLRADLDRLMRIEKGVPLDPQRLGAAWARLMKTGYFSAIRPYAEPTSDANGAPVRLVFDATGNIIITRVDVEYVNWRSTLFPKQLHDQIRKRTTLRKGGVFPDDEPSLDNEKRKIREIYEREGYRNTKVELITRPRGTQDKAVELTIRVTEGERRWLAEVLVAGNEAFDYAKVLESITTGERIDFWKPFFGIFGFGKYDRRRLREQLEIVEQRYRDAGYYAARVRLRDELDLANSVYPVLEISEGPHVTLEFAGNKAIGDGDLQRAATFRESGAIDDTEIEATELAYREAYEAIGRYYVEISHRRERLGNARQRITFDFIEGPRVYVRRIELIGHHSVSRDAIFDVMATRGVAPSGVISAFDSSAGILQDAQIINDLTAIRDLYYERGFPRVQFRCMKSGADPVAWQTRRRLERSDVMAVPGEFDIWSSDPAAARCYSVQKDADPRLVTVTIELNEGRQTTIDSIELGPFLDDADDDSIDDLYDLLENLGFVDGFRRWKPATGLNLRNLDAVRGFIQRWYRNAGYLTAGVESRCGDTARANRPCTTDALYATHLDHVDMEVERGPRYVTEGVFLRGNLLTMDHVIRNELLVGNGRPLGRDAVHLSKSNLRSLGLFESVRVDMLTEDEPARAADEPPATRPAAVVVTVEESDYEFWELATGVRINTTPLGGEDLPLVYLLQAGWRDRNWLQRGLELAIQGEHENRFDTPTDIESDDAKWAFGPIVRDRRFLGTKWDFTGQVSYRAERSDVQDAYTKSIPVGTTLGYDFYRLSYPSDWGRGLRTTLGTEFQWEEARGLTRKGERPPFGDATYSLAFTPRVIWDRRDSPLHPTRGWSVEATSEILFGSDEPLPSLLSPSFRETLTAQYVFSLFRRRLVFASLAGIGAVQSDKNEAELKSDFLFKAGGDGVAFPVRGYEEFSIQAAGNDEFDPTDLENEAPVSRAGRALARGSIEARFPTFIADDWWFALFSDVGAVADQWGTMTSDRVYPSVGGGLRWLITGQIPLRLDIGVPLRANSHSPRQARFVFNIFYML